MATDRIREWILANEAKFTMFDVQGGDVIDAEALLRAALADKTLIDGELQGFEFIRCGCCDSTLVHQRVGKDYQVLHDCLFGKRAKAFYQELAAVIAERDRQYEYNIEQVAKQAELEAELAAARQDSERLREWAQHQPGCHKNSKYGMPCICGLDAAMEAQREKAK